MKKAFSQTCLIIGIILIFLGAGLIIFEPYGYILKKITTFYPDGIISKFWYSSDVQLVMKLYIFNITNKDAFLTGIEKLKFQEVGPYVYRFLIINEGDCKLLIDPNSTGRPVVCRVSKTELKKKNQKEKPTFYSWACTIDTPKLCNVKNYCDAYLQYVKEEAVHHNLTFNHEEGTVSSSPRYGLHWVPELSKGRENDTLVLPHLAMLLFCSKFSYLNLPLNAFIAQTKSWPIVEQTVREFLFGYENAFVEFGHNLFPFWIKFDKIGILDRVYDHEGDVATTYSGEVDRHKTGLFATYNNLTYLPHWDAPCNNVAGSSDGKKFGNDIKPNEKITFYRKGICRALPLETVSSEIIDTFGIPTFLYKFEDNIFDNGEFNERNKCFCKRNPRLPNTIQEISDCFYGFPVALSFPHFLNGSDALREPFDGLNPDSEKHDSYVYINPDAGYITKGSVKLQVNALLGDLGGILEVKQFSNMILPLIWAEFALDRIEPEVNILLCLIVRILPALETTLAFVFIIVGISTIVYHTRKIMRLEYDSGSFRCKSEFGMEK